MFRNVLLSALVSLLVLGSTNGFAPSQQRAATSSTSLNIFGDAFKNAFSNDDSLGERKNEGLAGGPNYNENVTMNGKAVPGCVVGQKLTVVGGKARVKIPVNCQAGDCGEFGSSIFDGWMDVMRHDLRQCVELIRVETRSDGFYLSLNFIILSI